jgi:hypothetical protein
MPQQLIYTSAPRGIVAGRSGYCTVARSAAMREALALRLEQLSYYQHLSLGGAAERPIFAHRLIDIRGSRFHVLSRIQDAGLDFTGRTNFMAHHVAFSPEECGRFATPPVILRDWQGWVRNWSGEPRILENEDWSAFSSLAGQSALPAQNWRHLTGDAVNALGLLELPSGVAIRIDGQSDETVLSLFAESLELLEVRETRGDWRTGAWQYTFTSCIQQQDNPADFRWRGTQSEAAVRGEARAISEIVAAKWTDEEAELARGGRQAPRFILEPQNTQVSEGENARLEAQASGVPNVVYQWFKLERDKPEEPVPGATTSELVLKSPPRGISRYFALARNSVGEARSQIAVLSVELRAISVSGAGGSGQTTNVPKDYQKSAEQIELQRLRIEEQEREKRRNKGMFFKLLVATAIPFVLATAALIAFAVQQLRKAHTVSNPQPVATPEAVSSSVADKHSDQKSSTAASSEPLAHAAVTASNLSASNSPGSNILKSNAASPLDLTMSQGEQFAIPPGFLPMPIGPTKQSTFRYLPDAKPRTVEVSGAAEGFDLTNDSLIFLCRTNSQKEFSARLISMESPTPGSRCGIMVRQNRRPDSPFIFVGQSSRGLMVYMRDAFGNFYSQTNSAIIPVWLKISEVQNGRFAPSWSSGGVVSSMSPEYSVDMKRPSLVGFALASGNMANIVKARFAVTN